MDNQHVKEIKGAKPSRGQRTVDNIIYFLEKVAILVRDFGMPVIMFGMGLYVFGWVFTVDQIVSTVQKLAIGFFLTAGGLLSQLWLEARKSRRNVKVKTKDKERGLAQSTTLEQQLERITKLLADVVLERSKKV